MTHKFVKWADSELLEMGDDVILIGLDYDVPAVKKELLVIQIDNPDM